VVFIQGIVSLKNVKIPLNTVHSVLSVRFLFTAVPAVPVGVWRVLSCAAGTLRLHLTRYI